MSSQGSFRRGSFVDSVLQRDLAGVAVELSNGSNPDEPVDTLARTPLMHAAISHWMDLAELLVKCGADVNRQDSAGYTALHFAAQEYDPDMIALLLRNGANTETEDKHGSTPLAVAVFHSRGRGRVIEELVQAGANKQHRNKWGQSPMDVAALIANYDISRFLK